MCFWDSDPSVTGTATSGAFNSLLSEVYLCGFIWNKPLLLTLPLALFSVSPRPKKSGVFYPASVLNLPFFCKSTFVLWVCNWVVSTRRKKRWDKLERLRRHSTENLPWTPKDKERHTRCKWKNENRLKMWQSCINEKPGVSHKWLFRNMDVWPGESRELCALVSEITDGDFQ